MRSFDLYDAGRPDEAQLAERFGLRPPTLYVRFAQWCYDHAGGDADEARLLYWSLLGLEADCVDSDGYASPFELFSIGDYDGDQVGWLVMAEETWTGDGPWAWFQHDGNAVVPLAADSREFFSLVLSCALIKEPDDADDARAAAAVLGIDIHGDLGGLLGPFGSSRYWERGEPAPTLKIDVPDGYRYLPPGDERGVGVLAPADEFTSASHRDDRAKDPTDVAAELGNAGYSASALWHLLLPRVRFGSDGTQHDYFIRYSRQAYLNLGRPRMAQRVGEGGG